MDYATLVAAKTTPGSLASWANDARVQTDASFMVQEAESYIYRSLRHWRMLSLPTTGNMTIGSDTITIPDDLLEPFMFLITGQNFAILDQRTVEQLVFNWSYQADGTRTQQQPRIYSFNQTNLMMDSLSDQEYPYVLIYYQQPAPLATSSTNFLTTFYPKLLRAACMMVVAEWEKDYGAGQGPDTRTYWGQIAERELQRAQQESDRARRGITFAFESIGGGPREVLPTYG